jgi:hypothetical protein
MNLKLIVAIGDRRRAGVGAGSRAERYHQC